MSQRGKSNIDRDWNEWKQAARIIELESERWRDSPFEVELRAVATKLLQLGYLPASERRRILAAIDRAEQ